MAELGFPAKGAELDALYKRFTALADRKKNIYDQDLVALMHARPAHAEAHEEVMAQAASA
jgi:2-isopropylmalate synthase